MINTSILNNTSNLIMVNNQTVIPFNIEDYTLYIHPMLVNFMLTLSIGAMIYGFLIAIIGILTLYFMLPIELVSKKKD